MSNARGVACYGLGIMEIEGRRRSSNFEDRGQGGGGGVPAGGLPIGLLVSLVRVLGFKGVAVLAVIGGAVYFFMPSSLRHQLLGGGDPGEGAQGAGSVCQATPANGKACDFSRVVLASTEDVWTERFQRGELPSYGRQVGAYRDPTLAVFSRGVATGCGLSAAIGLEDMPLGPSPFAKTP